MLLNKINVIEALTCAMVRSYSRRASKRPEILGIMQKVELARQTNPEQFDLEMDDQDPDDTSPFESDLMNAHKSHIQHEREIQKAREKLQQDITVTKYFKNIDPSFLTLVEEDKIKRLHEEAPEEWTVEVLSQKFPALPDTIAKVLKRKWKPTTVERVLKHDKKIAQNWERFHQGKLPVSTALRDHLLKFGKRKIDLLHSEAMAPSLVAPLVEIPKPKHQLFSNMATETKREPEQALISTESNLSSKDNRSDGSKEQVSKKQQKKMQSEERLTFGEFAEKEYNDINAKSSIEGTVLLDAYNKHQEIILSKREQQQNLEKTNLRENPDADSERTLAVTQEKKVVVQEVLMNNESKENSLSTSVVEKKFLEDMPTTYLYPIKIPKGAYKKGKTYRINDCYYDDDGEFLYRIPGLKN